MMSVPISSVASPAIRKPSPKQPTKAAVDFKFDTKHSVTLRASGLFMPDGAIDLRKLMDQFNESRVTNVDFEIGQASFV